MLNEYVLTPQDKARFRKSLLVVKKIIRQLDDCSDKYENSSITPEDKQNYEATIRAVSSVFPKIERFLANKIRIVHSFFCNIQQQEELTYKDPSVFIEKYNVLSIADLLLALISIREELRSEIHLFLDRDWYGPEEEIDRQIKYFKDIVDILDNKKDSWSGSLWGSLALFSQSISHQVEKAFQNNDITILEPLGNLANLCWSRTDYGFLSVNNTLQFVTHQNINIATYAFKQWGEQLSQLGGFSVKFLAYDCMFDCNAGHNSHYSASSFLLKKYADFIFLLLSRGGCLLDIYWWHQDQLKEYSPDIYEYYVITKDFFSAVKEGNRGKVKEILNNAQEQKALDIFLNTTDENFENAFQVVENKKNKHLFSILVEYSHYLTYMTPVTKSLLQDYKNKKMWLFYSDISFKWDNHLSSDLGDQQLSIELN